MIAPSAVGAFARLFSGRDDAYGSWEGGCVRAEVTTDTYRRHLNGDEHVGIYPLRDDGRVAWGCVDIDFKEYDKHGNGPFDPPGIVVASNLQKALDAIGIPAHIEETVNGFHVWVFAEDEWVEASVMNRALRAACQVIKYDPKEVNPKQFDPNKTAKGLGNYVRLPYPGGDQPHRVMRQVKDFALGDEIPFEEWLTDTYYSGLTPTVALRKAASLYKPPARPKPPRFDGNLHPSNDVGPLVKHIIKTGVTSDRSTFLAHIAKACAEENVDPRICLRTLQEVDQRLRKFADRADAAERYQELVDNAY